MSEEKIVFPRKKFIITIYHFNKYLDDYKRLILELKNKGIKSIGMEIPSAWKEMAKRDKVWGRVFFFNLAEFAEANGIKVIGLENEKLHIEGLALLQARKALIKLSKNEIEARRLQARKYISNKTLPKRQTKEHFEIDAEALSIASVYNKEKVEEMWHALQVKRDETIMEIINNRGINVSIMGDAHARNISRITGIPTFDYKKIVENEGKSRSKYREEFDKSYVKNRLKRQKKISKKIKPKLPH